MQTKTEQLVSGRQVIYHAGWDPDATERCEQCHWPCSYRLKAIIQGFADYIGHEQTDQWLALTESGSYVVGVADQFDLV